MPQVDPLKLIFFMIGLSIVKLRRKKNLLKLLLSFSIFFISLTIIKNLKNKISKDLPTINNYPDEIDDCHKQWFMLNNHLFFRPHLAYYYLDLKQLKMFYLKHLKYNYSLTLNLMITVNSNLIILKSINNYNTYENKGYLNFRVESLVANFSLSDFMSSEQLLTISKSNLKMQVLVETQDKKHKLNRPIQIRIKNFREANHSKKKLLLCGKNFYFNNDYAKSFVWWIELNRMHGYDKLVFYNHSIPNSEYLSDAFKKHSDFIEIKQLQCYPNLESKNNTNRLFIRNDDFKNVFKFNSLSHQTLFEHFCFNECYLENKDKYEQIAINDQDESIITSNNREFILDDFRTKSKGEDEECSANTITSYFKNLNLKLNSTGKYIGLDFSLNGTLSYHFYMSFFVNYHLTDEIFSKLNAFFKVNKKFKQIVSFNVTDPNDDGLWFNILIQKETDYEYARKLTHLYLKQLKPFLDLNKNVIKQMPEPFSRLFFINGENAYKFCGKTVHNTQISDWVTTHYPGEINYKYTVWIKYEYGYISHFRKSLKHNMHEKNISISDFNFDFNYFSCYFKHIAKQLNYKLVY